MKNTGNLFARARKVMPGGVSSPVRAFRAVRGDPRFVARGSGALVTDTEGRTYVDFVGSWGPLILGHAHPAVVEAVTRAARDGLSFGATCAAEIELYGRGSKLVSGVDCAPCYKRVCPIGEVCMTDMRPELLESEALALIGRFFQAPEGKRARG